MSAFLDDPAGPEQDALGRTALAKSIYSLVKGAPPEWTLRIGVYGRWGEGKTTLLDLIASLATSEGLPVARFNPSAVSDSTQLWNLFFLAIADAFAEKTSDAPSGGSLTERIQRIRAQVASRTGVGAFFKAAAPSHPIAGPLFRILELGSDTLRQQIGLSAASVEATVRGKAGAKRLIVFVDDVDRVEPHLVPRLLLALRELNVHLTAFLVAVDPEVVTQGLSAVHPGWKDAPEFLEKILQFHYWLPPLDPGTVSRFARLQIPATKLDIPADVVEELAPSLPRNPRKLKEFFRSLWQLTPVIRRHEPSDVDWTLLLLLELIRAESPLAAAELLRSKPFRESLAVASFYSKTSDDKQKKESEQTLLERFESIAGGQLTPQRKERLLRLIARFADAALTTQDRIEYWANIRERPPVMTSREAGAIFDAWTANNTTATVQRLLQQHSAATATDLSGATSALFRKLIEMREARLSAASDSELLQELQDNVTKANAILSALSTMIRDLGVLTSEPRDAAVVNFVSLYNHFIHWAHFDNTPEYVDTRQQEHEILLQAANLSENVAAAVLRQLKFSDPFAQTGLEAAAQVLRAQVISALLPFVIADVRKRFERPEGITSLRGPESEVERHLLLSPTAGLYSDEFVEHLRLLSVEAKTNLTVQKNLIELVRSMANSYTDAGGASEDAQKRRKKAAEFLPHVWAGAVASPIQPRLFGDLRQDRDRLNDTFKSFGVQLSVPSWWRDPPAGPS